MFRSRACLVSYMMRCLHELEYGPLVGRVVLGDDLIGRVEFGNGLQKLLFGIRYRSHGFYFLHSYSKLELMNNQFYIAHRNAAIDQ